MKRVLVLGDGLSSWVCALAAARAGASVQLANMDGRERAEPTAPLPVHVPPNMLRALVELGVAEPCFAAGFPYRERVGFDATGRVVSREPLTSLAGPLYPPALGIAHATLANIVLQAALAHGVAPLAGRSCVELHAADGEVRVRFNEGSGGRYALVLAAAFGAHTAAPPAPAAFIGQCAWAVIVRRPLALDRLVTAPCSPGGSVTALPIGNLHAGVLLSVPGEHDRVPVAGRAQALRRYMSGLTGSLAAMREQVRDDEAIDVRPLYSGMAAAPWYRDGVLLFGDAAHAVAPHLGQAQAQSFEDAVVLCDVLRHSASVAEAAARFEHRRIARCGEAVALGLQAARWQLRPTPEADLGQLVTAQLASVSPPP